MAQSDETPDAASLADQFEYALVAGDYRVLDVTEDFTYFENGAQLDPWDGMWRTTTALEGADPAAFSGAITLDFRVELNTPNRAIRVVEIRRKWRARRDGLCAAGARRRNRPHRRAARARRIRRRQGRDDHAPPADAVLHDGWWPCPSCRPCLLPARRRCRYRRGLRLFRRHDRVCLRRHSPPTVCAWTMASKLHGSRKVPSSIRRNRISGPIPLDAASSWPAVSTAITAR